MFATRPRKPRCRPLPLRWLAFALALTGLAAQAQPTPQLQIEGGSAEQRQNIEAFVRMSGQSCDLPRFRERNMIRDARRRAQDALRALGHYEPVLAFDVLRDADCWNLKLELDPGPPILFADVDVRISGEGAEDPVLAALASAPGITPGQPLRHDLHDQLRDRLIRVAYDRGYLTPELVTSELRVDPAQREARVILHLETGPRFRFGEVRLEQDILDPSFVQRLIPFETGSPFAAEPLVTLRRNLGDSGYFQAVRVRPLLDDVTGTVVPIQVQVEPRPRYAYEFSLGYSTDIGPRLGAAMEHRYVNQRGHRYRVDLNLAPDRSEAGFNYDIPLADPLRDSLDLFVAYRTEEVRSGTSDRLQLGANHRKTLPSGWQITRGIRYEYEEFTIGDVTDTSNLLIPSYQINRTRSDDFLYPRSGHRIDLLVQGAYEDLGSSLTFLQTRANVKWIRGAGAGRLILRGDAGLTTTESVEQLPTSLRFFAGGDTSVRGFGFQRLGPTDGEGRVIGGRHLLVGSVEYDYPLGDRPWAVAVFADIGNAFDEFDDYELKAGAGVGLRWRSPVGPLRLDVAHAPDSDDDFRIHFTMGPDL
ncbi:MAG TPA: autotransporter assembly complex family protein [Thioalkalivibrio sp.]|jgi:translocation and assembly module TamA|nr:autotransporter assembly complex family protein [Thioalkalivibrio sp.]